MSFLFKDGTDVIECPYCKYKLIKPYPKDKRCPKCNKIVESLIDVPKPAPKSFETMKQTASTKLWGKVKVKDKDAEEIQSFKDDKVELKKDEYVKLLGVSSVNRTPLFCSNEKYVYLLELTNNLDFIATSILGGELDKMLLISETDSHIEKCQFLVKNDIIYIVYGIFPDKKGKWVLEQMQIHFSDIVNGKDVDTLGKIERYEINKEFNRRIKFILEEYLKLQEVFSDQDLPYIDPIIRIDYLGLSFKSIGLISILLSDELNVDVQGEFENEELLQEMKESILTAKIEAIAANTRGNTGAIPRWIAVKLGFQQYRFLTFKKFQEDYFLCFLCEGNLKKLEKAEMKLESILSAPTENEFKGDLRPFNELKRKLITIFEDNNRIS